MELTEAVIRALGGEPHPTVCVGGFRAVLGPVWFAFQPTVGGGWSVFAGRGDGPGGHRGSDLPGHLVGGGIRTLADLLPAVFAAGSEDGTWVLQASLLKLLGAAAAPEA